MSPNPLAYHSVVHALEAASGWTPQSRFASAIAHSINGHLPYERYLVAGRVRQKANTSADTVERLVQDWLSTDLNPAVQFFRSSEQVSRSLLAFNAYNSAVNLAVRTTAVLHSTATSPSPLIANRNVLSASEDPEPCRLGTYFVLNSVVNIVACNEHEHLAPRIYSVFDIANDLGVACSAGAEVAFIFEMEGSMPVGEVARKLGCHQRTLERQLRAERLTAEAIRMSTRLIRATKRLRSADSLTAIAIEEGFSDQAHMTRAFRASCGMMPSLLRKVG